MNVSCKNVSCNVTCNVSCNVSCNISCNVSCIDNEKENVAKLLYINLRCTFPRPKSSHQYKLIDYVAIPGSERTNTSHVNSNYLPCSVQKLSTRHRATPQVQGDKSKLLELFDGDNLARLLFVHLFYVMQARW